jgi:hypothetical protein
LYTYARNDPANHTDPTGKDTILITWYGTFLGMKYGQHSAIFITGHQGSTSDGYLYDPSGSYEQRDESGQMSRNTSGTFEHAALVNYIGPGLKEGYSARLTTLTTTEKEEAYLKDRSFENGDHRGFNCATDCSVVLHELPGLKNLDAAFPGSLANQAAASSRATKDIMISPNGTSKPIPKSEPLPPIPSPCDRIGSHSMC